MDTVDADAPVTPILGLDAATTARVLATAGRAPSLHNAQPWRFRTGADHVELRADPARRLPVADPTDRELRIGCGAALYSLRLALAGAGIRPLVTRLPDPSDPQLLAVVRRGAAMPPTPEQRRLLEAVPRRHTNRRPFSDVPVPAPARTALTRAAYEEGAWLQLVTDPDDLAVLGRLAREAHARQSAGPAFVAEMAAWTGRHGGHDDGVPASAGGPLPAPNHPWVTRDFGGPAHPQPAPAAFESAPLIAVLTSHLDGPRDDLRAGEALARVLLTATAEGLSASPVSQLVEVPDVRERVRRSLARDRPPQVVLRLGHGVPVPATPRRPAADLVDPG